MLVFVFFSLFFYGAVQHAPLDHQAFCDDGLGSRCATVIDNNGTHENVDITPRLKILKPVQVTLKNALDRACAVCFAHVVKRSLHTAVVVVMPPRDFWQAAVRTMIHPTRFRSRPQVPCWSCAALRTEAFRAWFHSRSRWSSSVVTEPD